MYDKIVDAFDSSFSLNLDVDCFRPAKLGRVGEKKRASIGLIPSISILGISEAEQIKNTLSLLNSQLQNEIVKSILKYIMSYGEVSYLDFTSTYGKKTYISRLDERNTITRKVVVEIDRLGSSHIVTNSRQASDFMDCSAFSIDSVYSTNSFMYKVGSLRNFNKVDLYIDPLMRWTDNFILLFDEVHVDISNASAQLNNLNTFNPRLDIECGLSYEVINPRVLYIFDDDHKENYGLYKQISRDIKINQILGTED